MKVKWSNNEVLVQDSPRLAVLNLAKRGLLGRVSSTGICGRRSRREQEWARRRCENAGRDEGRNDEESQRVVEESGRECRVFATWQVLSFVLRPPSFPLTSDSLFFFFQGERRHLSVLLFVDRPSCVPQPIFPSFFSLNFLSQFLGLMLLFLFFFVLAFLAR